MHSIEITYEDGSVLTAELTTEEVDRVGDLLIELGVKCNIKA